MIPVIALCLPTLRRDIAHVNNWHNPSQHWICEQVPLHSSLLLLASHFLLKPCWQFALMRYYSTHYANNNHTNNYA